MAGPVKQNPDVAFGYGQFQADGFGRKVIEGFFLKGQPHEIRQAGEAFHQKGNKLGGFGGLLRIESPVLRNGFGTPVPVFVINGRFGKITFRQDGLTGIDGPVMVLDFVF